MNVKDIFGSVGRGTARTVAIGAMAFSVAAAPLAASAGEFRGMLNLVIPLQSQDVSVGFSAQTDLAVTDPGELATIVDLRASSSGDEDVPWGLSLNGVPLLEKPRGLYSSHDGMFGMSWQTVALAAVAVGAVTWYIVRENRKN